MTKKQILLAIASYCDADVKVNGVGKTDTPTWGYLGSLSQLHLKLIEKGKKVFWSFYSDNKPKNGEPVWGAWLKNTLLESSFNSTEFSVSDSPVSEAEGYVIEFCLGIKWNEWGKLDNAQKDEVKNLYSRLKKFIEGNWPKGGKQSQNEFFAKWNAAHTNEWTNYLKQRRLDVPNDQSESKSNISDPRNLIYFGAPGTGKSFKLNADVKEKFTDGSGENATERYERVTFYPTYSYAQFVGCYKPVMKDKNTAAGKTEEIAYEFVPGPFLRVLVNALRDFFSPLKSFDLTPYAQMTKEQLLDEVRARGLHVSKFKVYSSGPGRPWKNKQELIRTLEDHDAREKSVSVHSQDHCLVIEEINRANAAAVFGDVFQLLDRDSKSGESEYDIAASEDVKRFLQEEFKDYSPSKEGDSEESKKRNPLFFLKVDFKKDAKGKDTNEWESCRLRIPSNMYIWATMNSADQGVFPMDTAFKRRWEFEYVGIDEGVTDKLKTWTIGSTGGPNWNSLRMAVNGLLSSAGVNEDKLMGPWFVKPENGSVVSEKQFTSKVLMYLWEDAARMCRKKIFIDDVLTFSGLISKWKGKDGNGAVFKFPDNVKNMLNMGSGGESPGA